MADPTRRAILDRLREGGLSVNAIASDFPVSRPAISKHLRLLREADLIAPRREGRKRIYELRPEPLAQVEGWLEGHRASLKQGLARLRAHVESERQDEPKE